jgi:hypothetical protein
LGDSMLEKACSQLRAIGCVNKVRGALEYGLSKTSNRKRFTC